METAQPRLQSNPSPDTQDSEADLQEPVIPANHKFFHTFAVSDYAHSSHATTEEGPTQSEQFALQDYQQQLLLLEEQKKKMLESRLRSPKVSSTQHPAVAPASSSIGGVDHKDSPSADDQHRQMQKMLLEQERKRRLEVGITVRIPRENIAAAKSHVPAKRKRGRQKRQCALQAYQQDLMLLEEENSVEEPLGPSLTDQHSIGECPVTTIGEQTGQQEERRDPDQGREKLMTPELVGKGPESFRLGKRSATSASIATARRLGSDDASGAKDTSFDQMSKRMKM